MIKAIVVALLFEYIGICEHQNAPEVHIQGGIVRGKNMESRKGRTFHAFMGLRYAKPPLGDLRFQAPVASDSWDGVYDASKPHDKCPQTDIFHLEIGPVGVEDCLFLNVYTPQISDGNKNLLPVILYIHGGGFEFGEASIAFYGPELLMDKNVVLVMPNYRLGPLGFLSTGDEVVPGNNGLKDQAFALKWIKNNIKSFGGDPNRIVVYGESAGGASSHLHMLSPLTKDLIKGVISQSGVASAEWAISENHETVTNSRRLAEFLNCPTNSSQQMVGCLNKLPAHALFSHKSKFFEWGSEPIVSFRPVVETNIEGAFLPKHPLDIIASGEAANVPFVTGITTEDGAIKTAGYHRDPEIIAELDRDFDRISPITLDRPAINKQASRKIRKFYFGDKRIDSTTKPELSKLYTDSMFLLAADQVVRRQTKRYQQPVYYYLFGYRGPLSHGSIFGYPTTYDYGVTHADELLYLFNIGLFPNRTLGAEDEEMVEVFTSIWENFAATGNPTPDSGNSSFSKWKPVKNNEDLDLDYYFIESPSKLRMEKGLYSERINFWKSLDLSSEHYNTIRTDL